MENNNFAKIFFIFFLTIFLLPLIIIMLHNMFPNIKLNPLSVVLIILGVIIAWLVSTYNKIVSLNQRVKQSQSGIDVYLKQRFDLIPNLVETVKGYTKHEKEIMENISKLRSDYERRNEQDIAESQNLNDRYTRILAVVEAYPELKSNEAFLKLQKSLSKIESQLQAARRIYNSEVTEYNTKIFKFPSNLVAKLFGFKEKSLFVIIESERTNVNVKL